MMVASLGELFLNPFLSEAEKEKKKNNKLEEQIKRIAAYSLCAHTLSVVHEKFPENPQFQQYAIKSFKLWLMTRRFAKSRTVSTASIPCLITRQIWMRFKTAPQYSRHCEELIGHVLTTCPHGSMVALAVDKETIEVPQAAIDTYKRICALQELFPEHLKEAHLLFSVDNELGIREGFAYSPQVMQALADHMEKNTSSPTAPQHQSVGVLSKQASDNQIISHLSEQSLDFGSQELNMQYQSIVKKTMELHQHPLVTSHPPHQHLMHSIIHTYLPTVWKLHDKINSYKAWDTLTKEKSLHKSQQQLNTIEQMLASIEQQVLEDFFRQQKTMNIFLQSKINSLSHPKL